MAFIKIRLVRLFTALAVKTRKKRAIFTSEETKTTIMLRARKKKEKQTTEFTSVTYVWSWLRGLKELQVSFSCNNSEIAVNSVFVWGYISVTSGWYPSWRHPLDVTQHLCFQATYKHSITSKLFLVHYHVSLTKGWCFFHRLWNNVIISEHWSNLGQCFQKKSENRATRAIVSACHFADKFAALWICRAMFLQRVFQFFFLNTICLFSAWSLVRNSFYTVKNLLVCWLSRRFIDQSFSSVL